MPSLNESSTLLDPSASFSEGQESLASSSIAVSLQATWLQFARKETVEAATSFWTELFLAARLVPNVVLASAFQAEDQQESFIDGREEDRLLYLLKASFDAQRLEDGMDHPAEGIISNALAVSYDARIFKWFTAVCVDTTDSNTSASVLRCLGRQPSPGTDKWRTDLVHRALGVDDVGIRDAAVQAAETWGGASIRSVLGMHSDPVPWLQKYIVDVIDDLGE